MTVCFVLELRILGWKRVERVNKADALHLRLDFLLRCMLVETLLYRQTWFLWRNREVFHHQFLLVTVRTCSITDNLARPKGMVSLLLFDMPILGAAILILLVLHLAYGKHKQVLPCSPCAHPFCLPRLHNCSGWATVREEQVLLPAIGTRLLMWPSRWPSAPAPEHRTPYKPSSFQGFIINTLDPF